MPTSLRFQIRQVPGMQGAELTYSSEVIVDGPADAKAQGGEVATLITAFETGFKEQVDESEAS